MKDFPRKVLVSHGFGAGWSSWCDHKEAAQFMAEYEPIIQFLENDGDKKSIEFRQLLNKLEEEIEELFKITFSTGGSRNLEVREVNGPYRIIDYDGAEKLIEQDDSNLWFY